MPKTTRDKIKRELAQAYININWAGTYLLELYNLFHDQHPEHSEVLDTIMKGLEVSSDLIDKFAKEIYVKDTIDWQSWAGRGRPGYNLGEPYITAPIEDNIKLTDNDLDPELSKADELE